MKYCKYKNLIAILYNVSCYSNDDCYYYYNITDLSRAIAQITSYEDCAQLYNEQTKLKCTLRNISR